MLHDMTRTALAVLEHWNYVTQPPKKILSLFCSDISKTNFAVIKSAVLHRLISLCNSEM